MNKVHRPSLPSLNGVALIGFQRAATLALEKIRPMLAEEDKDKNVHLRLFMLVQDGGYKGLLELAELYVISGMVDFNQLRRAKTFSYEKATRLVRCFRLDPRIVSTFQAGHDRSKEQYGGAFLIRCVVPELGGGPIWLLVSISGIGEKEDEAIGLQTIKSLSWGTDQSSIAEIIRISKNSVAERLLAA